MAEVEKKKRINSKSKGNGFELTIAKKLSKELAPLNFMRTPGSGARVGGKNFATIGAMFGEDALKIFVGDVVPINEKQEGLLFNFSVETKFYKDQDTFTGLSSGTANIFKWFEEAVDDAAKINKAPLLIFKWNRTSTFVCLDAVDSVNLGALTPQFSIITYFPEEPRKINKVLEVFLLDELLKDKGIWFKNV